MAYYPKKDWTHNLEFQSKAEILEGIQALSEAISSIKGQQESRKLEAKTFLIERGEDPKNWLQYANSENWWHRSTKSMSIQKSQLQKLEFQLAILNAKKAQSFAQRFQSVAAETLPPDLYDRILERAR